MIFLINLIKKNLIISIFLFIGIILTVILMTSGTFNKELVLSKTSPNSGKTETINNSIPVIFYFSEEVDPKTINVKIFPETKFTTEEGVENGQEKLFVYPLPWWDYKIEYTITIDKQLLGKQGGKLKRDIIFPFSLVFPNNNPTLFQQPGPGPNN